MVDNDRLNTIMKPVRLIFTYDLEKLSHEDEVKRIQLWNELKNSESIFDRELCMDLSPDLRADIASQFSFAELRLAVAEQADAEPTSISKVFNRTELAIVPEYDQYNIFDVASANELAERMQRKNDIYHLALQYVKEYSALDAILDSPQIRKDLKIFLKKRYQERLNKVNEGKSAQRQKVDFNETGIVNAVFIPLAYIASVDCPSYNRHDVYQWRGRDNHAARMLPHVLRETVQFRRQTD